MASRVQEGATGRNRSQNCFRWRVCAGAVRPLVARVGEHKHQTTSLGPCPIPPPHRYFLLTYFLPQGSWERSLEPPSLIPGL